MNRLKSVLMMLLAALLIFGSSALADGEINPYYRDAQPPAQEKAEDKEISITLTCVQQPTLDQEGVWRLSADSSCQFCVFVLDENWDTNYYSGWTANAEFRYQFVVAGKYTLYVQATGSAGSGRRIVDLTIADDGVHPTLEDKVSSLAAQCQAAGCSTDFEKALWMHDWLTENACYDRTYSYYSADGVLIRGTGVCDSYRKAYQLLLEAVGVQCTYVTGGNHAWNQVKLGGEWYNVDVTWDDPLTTGNASVSGYENHIYFALPDELMESDHTFASHPHACSAYEQNYYIYTGATDMWTEPLEGQILRQLRNEKPFFDLTLPRWYMMDGGYYTYGEEFIVYNLAAYAMSRAEYVVGDYVLGIDTRYDSATKTMPTQTRFDGCTLSLPAALGIVPEEMFAGNTAALCAVIPDGVTSIGAGAFSSCTGLWRADIPDSVTSIGSNAFKNCPKLIIVCGENSAAHIYARSNGIDFVISDEAKYTNGSCR